MNREMKNRNDNENGANRMEAYTGFAAVYDMFMDNIPYKEWSIYLEGLLKEYGVQEGLVADLGCGTGKITEYLALSGYDMIGVDNSVEMLSIAADKKNAYKENDPRKQILYLEQDMRELELGGNVSAVVSICDSINYILEEEGLLQVFQRVNYFLEDKGIFIFDLNTEHKYRDLLGDTNISENREEASFIWENYYYLDEQINEYDLTIYVREEGNRFIRLEETHYQRAYSLEKTKELLEQAGMKFITAYDAFTKDAPTEKCERMYIIAQKGN